MTSVPEVSVVKTHDGHKVGYVSFNRRIRQAKVGKRWVVYVNGIFAGFIAYDLKKREQNGKEWESPAWIVRAIGEPSYREVISKHQAVTEILLAFQETVDPEWPDEEE